LSFNIQRSNSGNEYQHGSRLQHTELPVSDHSYNSNDSACMLDQLNVTNTYNVTTNDAYPNSLIVTLTV